MERSDNQSYSDFTFQSVFMCFLCAVFYFYQYIVRVAPGQCIDTIMSDLNVSASFAGQLSAWYLTSYSLAQIPVAILISKYGPKRSAVLGVLILSASNILQSFALSTTWTLIARALTGFGCSFGLLCSLQMLDRWFHPRFRGRGMSLIVVLGMLGAMSSQSIVSSLLNTGISWRNIFSLLGYTGLALSAIFMALLNDKGPYIITRAPEEPETSLFSSCSFPMLVTCIYAWFCYTPLGVIGDVWAPKIDSDLMIEGFISIQYAIMFGMLIGLMFFGYLADLVGFKPVLVTCGLANACLFLLLCVVPKAWFIYLFFGIGILSASSPLPIPFAAFLVPKEAAGTARGIANFAQMLGAAITTYAFGRCLDSFGPVSIINGAPIYGADTYMVLFAAIAISLISATTLLALAKPNSK